MILGLANSDVRGTVHPEAKMSPIAEKLQRELVRATTFEILVRYFRTYSF